MYIGQTSRSSETRIKEYRHIRTAQPEKSAVAENTFTQDHIIQLHDTKILSNKSGHIDRLITEAIKLELQSKTLKREDDLKLINPLKPN